MFRYLYITLVLVLFSCKSDGELSMERGIHYYDWKMYNEAILEFNKSKFYYMSQNNKSYDDIKLLAQTHYNLAITYSKLGMFEKALSDANYAFNLIPNKEYREIIGLIQKEIKQ